MSLLDLIYGNQDPGPDADNNPGGELWGSVTQKYYSNRAERDHFEQEAAMRLQGEYGDPLENFSPDELKHAFEIAQQDEYARAAEVLRTRNAESFVENNPWFVPNPRNGATLLAVLEATGSDGTKYEDIEAVANDLRERGVLETRSVEQQQESEPAPRRSSGLSSKRSAPPAPKKRITEQDLYNMPLEKLEQMIYRQAAGQDDGGDDSGR